MVKQRLVLNCLATIASLRFSLLSEHTGHEMDCTTETSSEIGLEHSVMTMHPLVMLTLTGYFRFYQCKEQRGDGKMNALECEQLKADLHARDSQSIEALMSEVDEYLSQQAKQALDDITSRLEQALEEVVERNFITRLPNITVN